VRDILAYADNFKAWTPSMEYAANLAAAFDARLTGVYICPSPMSGMPPYDAPQLLSALIEETREIETQAYESAPAFVAKARQLGVRKANWQVAEGHVPDVLAHIGNWHDLIVLGRNEEMPWGTAPMLGSAVLGSHMPCLIVPPACTKPAFDCIVLAWNGSPEAIRAIHASRPLLARAKRIVVLRGQRRERFSEIGWKPEFDISDYLARLDLRAEEQVFEAGDDEAGAALLDAAAKAHADVLVMGAYGRTRFSEWIFGGATRHVLAQATLPVLMRH
jgi:nucleotide-binding universal stress UspA family protein